ncbi:alpha/beta hydrolase [Yaniella halotolerans]|uniref:alpha/beta hydrolase n=1 Tax=Yaniella halotolerans TaxID=225453 RepID=UPI0003B4002B|nr:phospholipase [Yaniella halotolerans]
MHVRWSHETPLPDSDLVVFLHGFGADENDLLPLGNAFDDRYTIASVQAPKKLPDHFGGYCWFPISTELEANGQDIITPVQQLDDWVQSVASDYRSVSLLGFSQGMAMATSLMRMRPGTYATIIGLSGFVVDATETPELQALFQDDQVAATQQPFFWGYDPGDPIVASDRIAETGAWLRPRVTLEERTYNGIGHGIHPQEISHFMAFLNEQM